MSDSRHINVNDRCRPSAKIGVMRHVDAVRGYQRDILFSPESRYTVSGGNALTNCVVEAVENDREGRAPALSLRFYSQPYLNPNLVSELAERGHHVYDEDTPIGVEINLGLEMAQSLIEQISAKWPQLLSLASEEEADS
jgi:hypothetical protein